MKPYDSRYISPLRGGPRVPRVSTLVLALALAACGADAPQLAPGGPIILIAIDTLRADHLGLYGYEPPRLDALAGEGVVFEHAFAFRLRSRVRHV